MMIQSHDPHSVLSVVSVLRRAARRRMARWTRCAPAAARRPTLHKVPGASWLTTPAGVCFLGASAFFAFHARCCCSSLLAGRIQLTVGETTRFNAVWGIRCAYQHDCDLCQAAGPRARRTSIVHSLRRRSRRVVFLLALLLVQSETAFTTRLARVCHEPAGFPFSRSSRSSSVGPSSAENEVSCYG